MLSSCNLTTEKEHAVFIPEITSSWWRITGNPGLGEYTTENQEPVDFGVWQAADGTWQLWSCIRHTACGANTRLFYGWQAGNLTDTAWTPLGIMMEADTTLGEAHGGLQAPQVIIKDGIYHMLYGGWNKICLATSRDGKHFERVINETGTPVLFSGPMHGTRDPMVLQAGDKYHCYYTGHLNRDDTADIRAAVFCRTSTDLHNWSGPVMVSGGGRVSDLDGWGGGDAECPFVVQTEDHYVLFRNQRYGKFSLNTQYCSHDPMNFGVNDDRFEVGRLPVAAPEIIHHGNEYYMAALTPGLDGIRMAQMKFVRETLLEPACRTVHFCTCFLFPRDQACGELPLHCIFRQHRKNPFFFLRKTLG